MNNMKNLKYIKIILVIFTLSLISCDGDNGNVDFNPNSGQTIVGFTESITRLTFENGVPETGLATIEVGTTSLRNNARTVQISIDEENSTSTPDMYTIGSSVTIPANEFVGALNLSGNFDNLSTSTKSLFLIITSINEDGAIISEDSHRVLLKKVN